VSPIDEVEEFLALTAERRISIDSRTASRGDVFLAIEGERVDGNDYIQQAFERGADFAYSSKKSSDVRIRRVESIETLLGESARRLLASSDVKKRIAITGSNGKTTAKEIAAFLLAKLGRVFKTEGNLNTEIGLPLSLLNGRAELEGADFGVFEVGTNQKGDIRKLTKLLDPQLCVLLNVGTAHLGNFNSPDELLEEKLSIFDSPSIDFAIMNGDDARIKNFARSFNGEVRFFGINGRDFALKNFSYDEKTTLAHFDSQGDRFVKLKGFWNIGQIIDFGAAYLVSRTCGLEEPALVISEFTLPYSDRFGVQRLKGITLICDLYNSSLESWQSAISSIDRLNCRRKIAVTGSILEQGIHSGTTHLKLGHLLDYFDEVAFFNPDREIERAGEVITPSIVTDDPSRLALWLKNSVRGGDLVFFKASRGVALERVFARFLELMKDAE